LVLELVLSVVLIPASSWRCNTFSGLQSSTSLKILQPGTRSNIAQHRTFKSTEISILATLVLTVYLPESLLQHPLAGLVAQRLQGWTVDQAVMAF